RPRGSKRARTGVRVRALRVSGADERPWRVTPPARWLGDAFSGFRQVGPARGEGLHFSLKCRVLVREGGKVAVVTARIAQRRFDRAQPLLGSGDLALRLAQIGG